MTIVISERKGEEVLFLTDTMIRDPNQARPEVLPGRLKVVTIGPCVTVAFAGNADPAGVAIQEAQRALRRYGPSAVIELLRQQSSAGETDFVVAFHNPGAHLVRLRNGASVEVNGICTLGHDEPFRDLIERAEPIGDKRLRGSALHHGFIDRLLTGKHSHPDIGGFPMAVEATPNGHRYLGCVGAYTYQVDITWGKTTHQPIDQVYTGDGHFMFSVIPSEAVNVPVVGACLLQAQTGFVFSPIERPEPFDITLAPAESEWHGHEREMYEVLKSALAARVAAIT